MHLNRKALNATFTRLALLSLTCTYRTGLMCLYKKQGSAKGNIWFFVRSEKYFLSLNRITPPISTSKLSKQRLYIFAAHPCNAINQDTLGTNGFALAMIWATAALVRGDGVSGKVS